MEDYGRFSVYYPRSDCLCCTVLLYSSSRKDIPEFGEFVRYMHGQR